MHRISTYESWININERNTDSTLLIEFFDTIKIYFVLAISIMYFHIEFTNTIPISSSFTLTLLTSHSRWHY